LNRELKKKCDIILRLKSNRNQSNILFIYHRPLLMESSFHYSQPVLDSNLLLKDGCQLSHSHGTPPISHAKVSSRSVEYLKDEFIYTDR